jgi:excisionase family DNA binding protein
VSDSSKSDYISTAEVARTFGVTSETIRNWIERGLLTNCIKIGTRYRVPRAEVIRLARERYGE